MDKVFNKDSLLLYAVTDRTGADMPTFLSKIEQALAGGVTILQLREKNLDADEFLKEAIEVKKLCDRYGVPLIINDSVEVALKSGAAGVHVGACDDSVAKIRQTVGKGFVIGATAKTVERAKTAEVEGADYLGVGALFASSTKTNAVRVTAEQFKEICQAVSIPSVAIGGINFDNMDVVAGSGASGIAVVSAIFGASDVFKATCDLKRKAALIIKGAER